MYILHMVIWVFYCRSFYTPLRRAGHSKTGRILIAGTRLPAAEVIYMVFGYTSTYVLSTAL